MARVNKVVQPKSKVEMLKKSMKKGDSAAKHDDEKQDIALIKKMMKKK